MTKSSTSSTPNRVISIDAYRGFVMLAMASSGFGLAALAKNPEVLKQFDGPGVNQLIRWLQQILGYQFDHVAWSGCGFWDLIQPSFMFLVGVSLPFSYSRREREGESTTQHWRHVLWRSFVLVALGVFLSSHGKAQTNFTFVNVLSQQIQHRISESNL